MYKIQEKHFYILAALLHDIGKFYQRTGAKILDSSYEQYTKYNGYWHAAFTAQFIDKFLDKKFLSLIHESASHHIIKSGIIKTADIIASGHDRRPEELSMSEETNSHYITARMYSIFYILFDYHINEKSYINLSKQSNFFPSPIKEFSNLDSNTAIKESKNLYNKLFNEMILIIRNIKVNSFVELHHKFYPILKEYTTTIPSSTYNFDIPTISLFDHLKLTAAITNCLNNKDIDEENNFLIIEYDLSGIKSFVYNIGTSQQDVLNSVKIIRSRSFYVNILCDFIAYKIVNTFNVSYENVLYTTGGRGQVLVPNVSNNRTILKNLVNQINQEILITHNNKLFFKFSLMEVNTEDLQKGKFKELISSDNRKKLIDKNEIYEFVSLKPEIKNSLQDDNKKCLCCENNEGTNNNLCMFCEQLLLLNEQVITQEKPFVIEFDYQNIIKEVDISFKLGSLGQIIIHKNIKGINIHLDSFYLTINQPIIGEIKYLAQSNTNPDILKKDIIGSIKVQKLVVVKMDVDNFGMAFTAGFDDDKTTISKILTLSRNIDFFFTKVIDDICKLDKFKNTVFIIFSGGDDLSAVLPLSIVFEFINEANKRFNQYTQNHQAINISTGIALLSDEIPFYSTIKNVDKELYNAKMHEGKDSIGFLGEVIPNKKLSLFLEEVNYLIKTLITNNLSYVEIQNIYNLIISSLENMDSKEYAEQDIYDFNTRDEILLKVLKKIKAKSINSEQLLEELTFYKIIFRYVLMLIDEDK